MHRALPVLFCASGLAACAPQPQAPIPVDVAEAQCVRSVLGGDSNTAVTIGVGTGGGGIGLGWLAGYDGWGGGTGVAVSTTLPQAPAAIPKPPTIPVCCARRASCPTRRFPNDPR